MYVLKRYTICCTVVVLLFVVALLCRGRGFSFCFACFCRLEEACFEHERPFNPSGRYVLCINSFFVESFICGSRGKGGFPRKY